jgi:prepilin-type N-terminal cleavage/methylation domain-containing protein
MNERRYRQAGVSLVELLVALAVGSLVLSVVVALQQQLGTAWTQSVARTAADRAARTALQETTRAVQSARSIAVLPDGGSIALTYPDSTQGSLFLNGQTLVLQRGAQTLRVADNVVLFAAEPAGGSGVNMHLVITYGSETVDRQTRAFPWMAQ